MCNRLELSSMILENRQLVTNGPVEVQDRRNLIEELIEYTPVKGKPEDVNM